MTIINGAKFLDFASYLHLNWSLVLICTLSWINSRFMVMQKQQMISCEEWFFFVQNYTLTANNHAHKQWNSLQTLTLVIQQHMKTRHIHKKKWQWIFVEKIICFLFLLNHLVTKVEQTTKRFVIFFIHANDSSANG